MKTIISNLINKLSVFTLATSLMFASCQQGAQNTESTTPVDIEQMSIRNNYIPTTISPEAQEALKAIYAAKPYERTFPQANDTTGWRKTHNDAEIAKKEPIEKIVDQFQAKIVDDPLLPHGVL